MEFSINEKGGTLGGKTGDQKQQGEYDESYGRGESHLKLYYDYPWNGILQCINEEIAFIVEADGTISKTTKDDGYTAEDKKANKPEKTDTDLAVEVWYGVHGNDTDRRKALGSRFSQVQKSVETIGKSVPSFVTASRAYLKKHGCKDLTE